MQSAARSVAPHADAVRRIEAYAWSAVEEQLNARGWAVLEGLLDEVECMSLAQRYDVDEGFRSRVVMQRHGYGQGEYRYFSYPLPGIVAALRHGLYGPLSGVANRWQQALGRTALYPDTHEEFLATCRAAGQDRPTPLLLRYAAGDYNCLHQDLYGEQVFPLQVAVLLSQPGVEFSGGELVLTEQRPRMQSRPHVVPLQRGDAVVFAVRERPVRGARGIYRTLMRHGVSVLRSGHRHTLGIIFHDAA
jgi:hypothetical protein